VDGVVDVPSFVSSLTALRIAGRLDASQVWVLQLIRGERKDTSRERAGRYENDLLS
jgi:hypothetical protein